VTSHSTTDRPPNGWISALVSIAIALAVAAVGGWATATSVTTWYAGLAKPAFTPPNGVFGPVWTTLYVLMALAAWRVWRAGPVAGRRPALVLYAVQLALNLLWSVLFFGLRQPGLALVEVVLLFAAILATAFAFWRIDRPAGLMLAPYAAWVAFASALNFEVWRLN
jgi:tryptophan-rich sensory protein